jgi:allantoate deiminase
MEEADLTVSMDAAATLIGRREGPESAPTLILGSHQDSIRHGGQYDGIMGVILPLLTLEAMRDEPLPFAVEIVAFADEEGVRFPTALMGPRALAGTFDTQWLDLEDRSGISLGTALNNFGGKPDEIATLHRARQDVLGYLEVHIEQGPVLESEGLPVGRVTGICGIERWSLTLTGQSAHAGTMPMDLRQDALACASEMILAIETMARQTDDFLAVVGQLDVSPNVVNAVPGEVRLTVELRAPADDVREHCSRQLAREITAIATTRGLVLSLQQTYAQKGTLCDDTLSAALDAGIASTGLPVRPILSGATHDASAMADLCPVAMMFVRCAGGISHHPDEAITAEDADIAVRALQGTIANLADRHLSENPSKLQSETNGN